MKALIGPTGYGSFGIVWRDFPYMQARGGYSGPFASLEEAIERAKLSGMYYGGEEPEIIEVPNVNEVNETEASR